MQLDHIVIYVRDLKTAIRDYTAQGFNVRRGGAHQFTENALIIFKDGSYLELITIKANWRRPFLRLAVRAGLIERKAKKSDDIYWRLLRWISGPPGIIDWCVATEDMTPARELWEAQGFPTLGPTPMDRTRPDGQVASWTLASAKTFDLPFFIQDISPREIRVPPVTSDEHPNGALGIKELTVPVDDMEKMRDLYEAMGLSELPIKLSNEPLNLSLSYTFKN